MSNSRAKQTEGARLGRRPQASSAGRASRLPRRAELLLQPHYCCLLLGRPLLQTRQRCIQALELQTNELQALAHVGAGLHAVLCTEAAGGVSAARLKGGRGASWVL